MFCELIFFNKALVANDKIQPIKILIIIVKGILIGIRSRSGIDVALTTTDKSNPKKIVPQPGPSRNLSEPPTQAAIIAIILPTKIKPADIIRIGLIGGGKLYID